jgi:hypothetical protein
MASTSITRDAEDSKPYVEDERDCGLRVLTMKVEVVLACVEDDGRA